MKKPPFEITNRIVALVAEISELTGKLTGKNLLPTNPTLRRKNRIRTIHGSLAIEQNSLNLEQVTAVLNGKQVLAPPQDIAEVRNAYEVYERMEELDPYSVDDLLKAHRILTEGLVKESGAFRTTPVGVVNQAGEIIHFGTLPRYVPGMVTELLEWAKTGEEHILIRSCVFHYELELIHPFADGNGRIGRLWHTLLLSKWNPAFAWLPVESMIYQNQAAYYEAINASNEAGTATAFVEFMLSAILSALEEAVQSGGSKPERRQDAVISFLKDCEYIQNSDVRNLFGVSAATANRILNGMVSVGALKKCRCGGHWSYRLP